MNLTPYSHMSFNIFIDKNLCFKNENIFFATRYAKNWMCPEFFKTLENMDVCTEIKIDDLIIFKN